jgi:hypothetical protein
MGFLPVMNSSTGHLLASVLYTYTVKDVYNKYFKIFQNISKCIYIIGVYMHLNKANTRPLAVPSFLGDLVEMFSGTMQVHGNGWLVSGFNPSVIY